MTQPKHDPVRPTPFDAAQPPPARPPRAHPAARSTRWVAPALLVLLGLAALVFFWLPERIPPPTVDLSTAPAAPEAGAPQPAPATAPPGQVAPWSDAQQARLRKEAQDVLEQLLDEQFALEEKGVRQWAPERFAAAGAAAAAADERYRSRDYEAATALYLDALGQLRELAEQAPSVLADRLQAARDALGGGDQAAALAALETAALIEPDNAEVATLRGRAERLPELLDLLASAAKLQAAGDLAGAEQQLRLATALDPEHGTAAARLVEVAQALRDESFNQAMSEGYAALDAGQFDGARQAFKRAATLRSDAQEAANALAEVDAAQTASSLSTLRRQGRQYEDRERWQEAVEAYRKALATDASLLFATEGLERAGARAQLDAGLRAVIDQPARLADTQVARAAEDLLRQARAVPDPGPVLQGQADRLATLLERANTPVPVTLRSDEATEVTVYKVARLGRFREHTLELRPGTYTAVGTRVGYRDVRTRFTVGHEDGTGPVTVICTEPI